MVICTFWILHVKSFDQIVFQFLFISLFLLNRFISSNTTSQIYKGFYVGKGNFSFGNVHFKYNIKDRKLASGKKKFASWNDKNNNGYFFSFFFFSFIIYGFFFRFSFFHWRIERSTQQNCLKDLWKKSIWKGLHTALRLQISIPIQPIQRRVSFKI